MMPGLVLYHGAPSRSSIVRWMLEEIGEPYEVRLLNLQAGEHRQPAFLAVNAMGKVPALEHDGVVITEAAAICCYLGDAFPKAGLAPPIGDPQRGPYLKWLFFGPSCFEPALITRRTKEELAPRSQRGWGEFDTVLDVITSGLAPGPFLLGDRFSTADVIIGSGLRWTTMMGALPPRPEFAAYIERLDQRPALQRANAKDAELMSV